MLALMPSPVNLIVTVPGGTPSSEKFPEPVTSVEMFVPAMLTLIDVVPLEVARAGSMSGARLLLAPITRPTILAPLDEPLDETPVGLSVPEGSPHATAAMMNARPSRSLAYS
jgi:hypothetical protein